MQGIHDHLGMSAWPFAVVPRPEHCTFIAGRPNVRKDIDSLVETLARRDTSSIQVLWSWYGAGKTHSLYYLKSLAEKTSAPIQLFPVYSEFPKGARGFVDLYRAFMAQFDVNVLTNAFLAFQTSAHADEYYERLRNSEPDFATSLRLLAMGDSMQRFVAQRWLRAERLTAVELRPAGLLQRLATTEQVTRILALVVKLLTDAAVAQQRSGARLVWLIDEFQRAHKAGSAVLADTNAGLHSLFNAAPIGFTPIISFSGSPASHSLPDWFSPELRDRIGLTKVLVLPPLQPSEAQQFVRDVLSHHRLQDGVKRDELFPFTSDACTSVIDYVRSHGELRPRALMKAFNAVLEAADRLIEKGDQTLIDAAFVGAALKDYIDVAPLEDE